MSGFASVCELLTRSSVTGLYFSSGLAEVCVFCVCTVASSVSLICPIHCPRVEKVLQHIHVGFTESVPFLFPFVCVTGDQTWHR